MIQSTLRLAVGVCGLAIVISLLLEERLPKTIGATSASGPSAAAVAPQGARAQLAAIAPEPPRGGGGIEYLSADRGGHFTARVEIEGVMIDTLVDTGATLVAFSAEDAERVGLRPLPNDFKYRTQTANGEVSMAVVKVRRIRLGSIELADVDAAVLPSGAFRGTLLGMSFLRRLASFQADGHSLILRQ